MAVLVPVGAHAFEVFHSLRGDALHWHDDAEVVVRISTAAPVAPLTIDAVEAAMTTVFATWMDTGCVPDVTIDGTTTASEVSTRDEPRPDGENIVLFVPTAAQWSALGHSQTEIALTLVLHDPRTGALREADFIVNDGDFDFTTAADPRDGKVDFIATMTHEAGHFFGLDHSLVEEATMSALYDPEDPSSKRTLAQDDIDGVCALQAMPFPKVPDDDGCAAGGASWMSLAALWLLTLGRRSAYASPLW